MDKNFLELLQLLNDHKVRYLVIGGYAVVHHTEPRYTKDLDIWIECATTNAKKVLQALDQFSAPIANLSIADLAKPGLIYVFGLPPIRIDLLNSPKGSNFKSAWENREIVKLGKIKVNFIGLKDLIKLKKAAGRLQDLADVEKLKKMQTLNKKS